MTYANRDVVLLFAARFARMFAYGLVSIILVLYLTGVVGLDEKTSGLLLSLTLAGDMLISLWMTTRADRLGRRKMLFVGALLMMLAGLVFVSTNSFPLLVVAAVIGVISPSGYEVGPFLAIEQAAISEEVSGSQRTHLFAYYNLMGSFATALGALTAGWTLEWSKTRGISAGHADRGILIAYAAIGLFLAIVFSRLSFRVEPAISGENPPNAFLGLHKSRKVVFKLSSLFAIDAFAGGFILQSFVAFWFTVRWGTEPGTLGTVFFLANVISGLSGLAAARIADRIGLIHTMVFTHIPSNILLMLVPLMPTFGWAMGVLLARFSISQMDVPVRQSFVVAVVSPGERSAAAGVTNIFRSCGAMLSPYMAGVVLNSPSTLSVPFFLAGGLKIAYDLLLLVMFRHESATN